MSKPGQGAVVLFLGHGAERTGPPVLLLRLCRWLKQHTELQLEFALLEGGPLWNEFEALGPVHLVEPPRIGRVAHLMAKGQSHFGSPESAPRSLPRPHGLTRPDVVYVNTAGSVRALRFLDTGDAPVISHVHELSTGLEHYLPSDDLTLLLQVTDHYLAVSEAVRDYLVGSLGVDSNRVRLQPGFVDDLPDADVPVTDIATRIPADALVVGACGSTGWRKAPDLFLTLALELRRIRPDLEPHFVWVGGATGEGSAVDAVLADAARCGLDRRVHLVGATADPRPWFRRFDVFALTSREDAFPLVGLEAAAAHSPIVCFDNGGLGEFVNAAGCGTVVPFPDLEEMARALVPYLDRPELRARAGRAGADLVRAQYLTSVRAPSLFTEIEAFVGRKTGRGEGLG